MKKPIWIVSALVVALILVRVAVSLGSHKSDKQQIQDALQASIQASKEGKSGAALNVLSSHLNVNDQDASSELPQLANIISKQKPDITVENQDPVVTGDTAQITSPVDVSFSLLGHSQSVRVQNVQLIFSKETGTQWLVFPTSHWKLSKVVAPQSGLNDLAQ